MTFIVASHVDKIIELSTPKTVMHPSENSIRVLAKLKIADNFYLEMTSYFVL